MCQRTTQGMKAMLLAWLIASSLVASTTLAQTVQGQGKTSATQDPATSQTHRVSPYHEVSVPNRARDYYLSVWGVDNLLVRQTASGNLIRFSYRVVDPARAKVLGDDHATPYMFGQRSHALLHIPAMENVGQLRQIGLPNSGQEYWMVFSNKGHPVNVGDRVNVIIGSFHADGLKVE